MLITQNMYVKQGLYIILGILCLHSICQTSAQSCSINDVACTNGNCVWYNFWCDGDNDCGDNSDERSCEGCDRGEFSCERRNNIVPECIDARQVCDGSCDCDLCDDEQGCFTPSSSINPMYIILPIAIITVMVVYFMRKTIKKKYRRWQNSRVEANGNHNNAADFSPDSSVSEDSEISGDSPPNYNTATSDNPVFVIDSQSFFDETGDLPTYEEAKHTLPSGYLESGALPPPPAYDAINDIPQDNSAHAATRVPSVSSIVSDASFYSAPDLDHNNNRRRDSDATDNQSIRSTSMETIQRSNQIRESESLDIESINSRSSDMTRNNQHAFDNLAAETDSSDNQTISSDETYSRNKQHTNTADYQITDSESDTTDNRSISSSSTDSVDSRIFGMYS